MRHLLFFAVLALLPGCTPLFQAHVPQTAPSALVATVDPHQRMIDDRKDEMLRRLATCESGDHGPSDRPIYGARGLYIGRFQFMSRTVINYVRQRDGIELTVKEATALAHDYDQAADLAKHIIFDLDGIWNWPLCNRKHGFAAEVKAIKAL
jgi:hypothetical protein